MRHALLAILQVVAVLLVAALVYGLTFLASTSLPAPYRLAAAGAAAVAVYWGAVRGRPQTWIVTPEADSQPLSEPEP